MKILFDQGTPVPLRRFLSVHTVHTAYELGWQTLENGDLLAAAEKDSYDLFVTTDQNLRYQQNLDFLSIGIVVLTSTSWPRIQEHLDSVVQTIETATAGSFCEIAIK